MKRVLLALVASALIGCATAPAIPMGNDTYMISQTSAGGMFKSMSSLKGEVMQRANAFAANKGKVAVPIAGREAPAYPGHMPSFEYQFRLVDKSDARAEGGALIPRADVVMDVHNSTPAVPENGASTQSSDVYTELLKLDDLRKRGIITDGEFQAQKAKLLSGG
ncbi:MAG: SHOCT domain-containing protein [Rhodanobacter sp.]